MHLTDGEIRTILDHEGTRPDRRAHSQTCPSCRQRMQVITSQGERVGRKLAALTAAEHPAPLSAVAAYPRLKARLIEKESTNMLNRIFSRPYRPAWIAFGLVAVLGLALMFPPVQAIANSFLGLFRVQRIAVVQINPSNLPEQLGSSSQLETLFTESVTITEDGEAQPAADPTEAASLVGFAVRLPQGLEGERILSVQPGGQLSFAIDLPRVQAVLDEIGRSDIRLPAELDGATVSVDISKSVVAMYGACEAGIEQARKEGFDPDSGEMPRLPDCTTLVQMPSPEVNAPQGLDVAAVGEAYLQLLGMSEDEAVQFARTIDWTTTFVIPIPRYGTQYQTVSVDGVEATYIQQNLENHARQYLLIWVKDGILYTLTGPGKLQDALSVANTIQ